MNWHSAAISSSKMKEFIVEVLDALGVAESELPESGTGDLLGDTGLLATYAVSSQKECAFFRLQPSADREWLTDVAHLRVGPGHYRILQTQYGQAEKGPTQELGQGSLGLKPANRLPTFTELATVLSRCDAGAVSPAQLLVELAELTQERNYYSSLAADLADELRAERARVKYGSSVSNVFGEAPQAAAQGYESFDQLAQWCVEHADSIVVLPRAIAAAKKSCYESPQSVYAALELLAGPYRLHRQGKCSLAEMQQALADAGLRLAGSVSANVAGEHKDDYFVSYQGRRRFLELHLLKGGGRDERYYMRVYFFWDAPQSKVVVGWLPSHLDNSLT